MCCAIPENKANTVFQSYFGPIRIPGEQIIKFLSIISPNEYKDLNSQHIFW
jgi:hypothetical protein